MLTHFVQALLGGIDSILDKFIPDANVRAQVARDLAAQAYKELELELQDRASARAREAAIKDYTPSMLAGMVTISYGVIQYYLLTHIIPAEMREIIMRTLGTLDMALGMVLGYYFGSSLGSHLKDKQRHDG
jgi:hypothetical protein